MATWARKGADPSALTGVRIVVRDLPGAQLGEMAGQTLVLDATAAGWGWWTSTSQPAPGRIDLLSVLVHELGHHTGMGHAGGVMAAALAPGQRWVAVRPQGAAWAARRRPAARLAPVPSAVTRPAGSAAGTGTSSIGAASAAATRTVTAAADAAARAVRALPAAPTPAPLGPGTAAPGGAANGVLALLLVLGAATLRRRVASTPRA
ncbi:MAG TPA: hypothetical protein VF314_05255, partial [Actinomycetes bacterium]